MSTSCGSCTLCCTLMKVDMAPLDEPPKPKGETCQHCDKGCQIYANRPTVCRDWSCQWLTGINGPGDSPSALRPDRCGVVLEWTPGKTIVAHCRTAGAWKAEAMRNLLLKIRAKRLVLIDFNDQVTLLQTDGSQTPMRFIGVDPTTNSRQYVRESHAQ